MDNNYFNQEDLNNLQKQEELFLNIMKKGLSGKQSDFEFIKSWQHRQLVKQYAVGTTDIIKAFTKVFNTTYKTYLDQIKSDSQDLGLILALKQFKQCIQYYTEENLIALDMLDEYRAYVWNGHIVDTLIGNTRKDEDCVDHRKLPLFWF